MSSPVIKTGGRDNSRGLVPAASALLSRAFASDPLTAYMLSSMPAAKRAAFLPDFFKGVLTAATSNHGTIDSIADRLGNASSEECGEWKSCGVLMPPGKKFDNPWTALQSGLLGMLFRAGWGGSVRMALQFPSLTEPAKRKGLKGQKLYYYVFFVGTDPAAEGQGLCSALMREYQARATKEELPIWLEATTEKSMRIYLKLGWEVVEEMVIGKGKAKADGTIAKGGEGVKIWGMIWWPPAKTSET